MELTSDARIREGLERSRPSGRGRLHVAADGLEALSAVATAPPDLIILDWNMPNMDGLTFLRKIREKGIKIPVIMCTTESEKSRVIQSLQAGANNYVVKPFTAEALAEKIDQTVKKLGIGAA